MTIRYKSHTEVNRTHMHITAYRWRCTQAQTLSTGSLPAIHTCSVYEIHLAAAVLLAALGNASPPRAWGGGAKVLPFPINMDGAGPMKTKVVFQC